MLYQKLPTFGQEYDTTLLNHGEWSLTWDDAAPFTGRLLLLSS